MFACEIFVCGSGLVFGVAAHSGVNSGRQSLPGGLKCWVFASHVLFDIIGANVCFSY